MTEMGGVGVFMTAHWESGKGRARRGVTLRELLIALVLVTLMMLVLIPSLVKIRFDRYRVVCANQMSRIMVSFLTYNDDYGDDLPHAGPEKARWTGRIPDWKAKSREDAFGMESDNPEISISATLYLAAKFSSLPDESTLRPGVEMFVCPADTGTTVFRFKGGDFGTSPDTRYVDLWDFGPELWKHVSYAFHLPYGVPLKTSSPPGMVVLTDRNPWQDAPGYPARPGSDLLAFDPNGSGESSRCANAFPHGVEGQNVLFLDGHVSFMKTPACGVNGDNIYTVQNGSDIMKGSLPDMESLPASGTDSLLLNDPPVEQ